MNCKLNNSNLPASFDLLEDWSKRIVAGVLHDSYLSIKKHGLSATVAYIKVKTNENSRCYARVIETIFKSVSSDDSLNATVTALSKIQGLFLKTGIPSEKMTQPWFRK